MGVPFTDNRRLVSAYPAAFKKLWTGSRLQRQVREALRLFYPFPLAPPFSIQPRQILQQGLRGTLAPVWTLMTAPPATAMVWKRWSSKPLRDGVADRICRQIVVPPFKPQRL